MAKNTHAQEVATGTSDSYTDNELADPNPPQPIVITRPILGEVDRATIVEAYTAKGKAIGEPAEDVRDAELLELEEIEAEENEEDESSLTTADGGDSTRSSQSDSSDETKPSQSPRQPVPTTENLSSQTPEETSAVNSTDGDGLKTGPQQSASSTAGRKTPAKKAAAPAKSTKARATMMGAEDDFSEFE